MTMMRKKQNALELLTTPDIPTPMRKQIEDMKGYSLHLVIQKQLEDIDVNKNDNEWRLCHSLKKILFDFTTQKERDELLLLLNKTHEEITVMEHVKILYETLRETSIFLKKSINVGRQYFYCLTAGWDSFVEKNSLTSGEIIQLWSFRRERLLSVPSNTTSFTSDLYFALNRVDPQIGL